MRAKAQFTQAGVSRAIAAAQKAGLYVVAIRPDGTVVVGSGRPPTPEILIAATVAETTDDWEFKV